MRRLGAGSVAAAVVLVGPLPAAAAHGGHEPPGPRVVADGLDNPRQLNWTEDGRSLVVAEAGRGGPECTDAGCVGASGAVTRIDRPGRRAPTATGVAEGLLSIAGPDGSFAVGANGADATSIAGGYVVAGYDPARPPGRNGALLAAMTEAPDVTSVVPVADLQAAEEQQNPDGAQIESNPYAVLYQAEDPDDPYDGYALVADAAANTVWKVDPDFDRTTPEGVPEVEITPWATWPTTVLPDGSDDPAGPAEFVPTALAQDRHGNVYVGGLGSERPGEASVVKFSADGEQLEQWGGFTAITGIAVDRRHLYVSQLFGPTPPQPPGDTPADEAPPAAGPGAPGQVVVVHTGDPDGQRWAVDAPLPAGLATDGHRVYAAVNSVAPAEGIAAGPASPFGAVGGGAVWELDFSAAYRVEPVEPGAAG